MRKISGFLVVAVFYILTSITGVQAQTSFNYTMDGGLKMTKSRTVVDSVIIARTSRRTVYLKKRRSRTVFVPRTLYRSRGRTRTVYLKKRRSRTVFVPRTRYSTRYYEVLRARRVKRTSTIN